MTEIGRRLGRNKSSVSRELKRNGNRDGSYHPWRGTSLYKYRRKASVRKPRLYDPKVLSYVRKHLGKDFMRPPEAITERLKMEHPGAKLSWNTLYRAIKRGVLKKEFLAKIYLRRGGKPPKRGNTAAITPEHKIGDRPECIKNRERPGDLEGDTVYGGIGMGVLVTLADRMTMLLYTAKADSRDSRLIADAIKSAIGDAEVNSFTFDNGSEFARHRDIAARHNATVYFADPHAPWQRGSNGNINGLLRRFFPKGTDFRKVTKEELRRVIDLINNRPRKRLEWKSPREVLAEQALHLT
jgi:IS30 family transposase